MKRVPRLILTAFGVLGLGVLIGALTFAVKYRTTLPVQGVVTDAVTGKPIEQMIVVGIWYFSRPNLVDSTGRMSVYHAVTDKNGRYSIPKNRISGIIDSFDAFTVRLMHPLYETKEFGLLSYSSPKYLAGEVKKDSLSLNIHVLSLADKFSNPSDLTGLAEEYASKDRAWYLFLSSRYGVKYDLGEVMAAWSALYAHLQGRTDLKGQNVLNSTFVELKIRFTPPPY
jgi:hypothetical protein